MMIIFLQPKNLVDPVDRHPLVFRGERLQSVYDLSKGDVVVVVGDHLIDVLVVGPLHAGAVFQCPFQIFFLNGIERIGWISCLGAVGVGL